MKLTDEFLRSKGLLDDHSIIGCHAWRGRGSVGVQTSCELCDRLVVAFPVSIAKAKADRTFHLVCLVCLEELKRVHEVGMRGVVRNNKIIAFD